MSCVTTATVQVHESGRSNGVQQGPFDTASMRQWYEQNYFLLLIITDGSVSLDDMPALPRPLPSDAITLADIYDAEIERMARAAYGRDYLMFGFEDWSPD